MNFAFRQKFNLKFIDYFLIASCMILVVVSTRSGIGISWDSTDYIAVGKNMANGKGPIDVVGLPMTVRPPGISSLICIGDWLGFTPSTSFVVINTTSAGLSTYFAMLILRLTNIRKSFELATLSIVAFSPSLLNMSSMAWSESVFIALVTASLWIALSSRSTPMHILLGILFTSMFFIRYVGPIYSFPIALIAIFSQSKQSGLIKSACRIGSIYFVSLVPQYLWLLHNKSIDGTLTGAREGAGGSYLQPIKTMIGTFGSWVVGHDPLNGNGGIYLNWNDYSIIMKISGCVFVASLVVLIFFLIKSIKQRYEASSVGLCLFSVSMFYITFSVIRFVHVEIGPLDNRMMSGVYIPLILIFGIGLDVIFKGTSFKVFAFLMFVCLLAIIGSQSILSAIKYGSNGRYWGSAVHKAQPLHQYVRTLDTKSQFLSNEPQMLYSVIEQSPIFNQYMNSRSFATNCTQRYIIWYSNSYLPDAKPIGGEVIYSDALGEIIHLGDCTIPTATFWP